MKKPKTTIRVKTDKKNGKKTYYVPKQQFYDLSDPIIFDILKEVGEGNAKVELE